jgi:hypothetical protein
VRFVECDDNARRDTIGGDGLFVSLEIDAKTDVEEEAGSTGICEWVEEIDDGECTFLDHYAVTVEIEAMNLALFGQAFTRKTFVVLCEYVGSSSRREGLENVEALTESLELTWTQAGILQVT